MEKITIKPDSGFKILSSTTRSQVATMVLAPGSTTGGPTNKHHNSDQWLYVISGIGKAVIENNEVSIKKGDLLLIEAGESHEIINNGNEPLETFNIYSPPEY